MSQKRDKPRRLQSWLSLAAVGVIVVAAGLVLGLAAGLTWEEPGLVLGWVTGESEGIAWGVADEPDPLFERTALRLDSAVPPDTPPVAAAPPVPAEPAAPPPPEEPEPLGAVGIASASQSAEPKKAGASTTEAPRPTKVAAVSKPQPSVAVTPPVPKSGFAVQVGAFSERSSADRLAKSLRTAGFPVYLTDAKGPARWKVRVGPHPTREAADVMAEKLRRTKKLKTWVLSEGA